MRTTLNIDQDVLMAAREIASQRGVSVGKVLSGLARRALTRPMEGATRNGVPIFPRQPDAGIVTPELVNRLRDEQL
jgi:aryl-alcohol dehydrogenase-like predicted oxidoreductase